MKNLLLKLIYKYTKLRSLYGNNVYCPCCENDLITFYPYGNPKRSNAQCPICRSLERHRLLWLYLSESTELFNPKSKLKLLHFAPEKCFYKKFKSSSDIEYTFGDIDLKWYPNDSVILDATNIQFQDDYFDYVICSHVLEHIIDDRLAMQEIKRVLKPNGLAFILVPQEQGRASTYEDSSITKPEDRLQAFGQSDHVRIYGYDFIERLEEVGFFVRTERCENNFREENIFKYGLIKEDLIYSCSKANAD